MTVYIDLIDAIVIYAGATVVVYVVMDIWEDFFK